MGKGSAASSVPAPVTTPTPVPVAVAPTPVENVITYDDTAIILSIIEKDFSWSQDGRIEIKYLDSSCKINTLEPEPFRIKYPKMLDLTMIYERPVLHKYSNLEKCSDFTFANFLTINNPWIYEDIAAKYKFANKNDLIDYINRQKIMTKTPRKFYGESVNVGTYQEVMQNSFPDQKPIRLPDGSTLSSTSAFGYWLDSFIQAYTSKINYYLNLRKNRELANEFLKKQYIDYKPYTVDDSVVEIWMKNLTTIRKYRYYAINQIPFISSNLNDVYQFYSNYLLTTLGAEIWNLMNYPNPNTEKDYVIEYYLNPPKQIIDDRQDFIFIDIFEYPPFFTSGSVDKEFKIISIKGNLSYTRIPKEEKIFLKLSTDIQEDINGLERGTFWSKSNNEGLIFKYDGKYVYTVIDGKKYYIFGDTNDKLTGYAEKAKSYYLKIAKCQPKPSKYHTECDRYGNFTILSYYKPFKDSYRFANPELDTEAYWKKLCNDGIVPIADFTIPATIFTPEYNIRGVELCGVEEWNKNVQEKLNNIKKSYENSKNELDQKQKDYYAKQLEIIEAHRKEMEDLKNKYESEISDLIKNNRKDIDIEIAKIQKMLDDKIISNTELKTKLDKLYSDKQAEFAAKKAAFDLEIKQLANDNQAKLNELLAILNKSGFTNCDDEVNRKLDEILEHFKPKVSHFYMVLILIIVLVYLISKHHYGNLKALVLNMVANVTSLM